MGRVLKAQRKKKAPTIPPLGIVGAKAVRGRTTLVIDPQSNPWMVLLCGLLHSHFLLTVHRAHVLRSKAGLLVQSGRAALFIFEPVRLRQSRLG
jgi:hypothetical protein